MKTKLLGESLIIVVQFLFAAQTCIAYYNPSTGRWLSRDPIEEKGGLNVYAFVNNKPTETFDRLGRKPVVIDFAGTSTVVNAEPLGADLCAAGGVDIVFFLSNASGDVSEWEVKNSGQFLCDGEPAAIHDYRPIVEPGKTEGGEWKVTCHSKTPFCPRGKHTGHTILTMNGVDRPGGQFLQAGRVDVEWTYFCNACCYQEGQTRVSLKRLFPPDRPK